MDLDLHGLIFETSIWLLAGSTTNALSRVKHSNAKQLHLEFDRLRVNQHHVSLLFAHRATHFLSSSEHTNRVTQRAQQVIANGRTATSTPTQL